MEACENAVSSLWVDCEQKTGGSSGFTRLFSIPNREPIKQGTKVICDTAMGEKPGRLAIDSFVVESKKALKAVLYLMPGATLPIKDIVCVVKEKPRIVEEITDLRTGMVITPGMPTKVHGMGKEG